MTRSIRFAIFSIISLAFAWCNPAMAQRLDANGNTLVSASQGGNAATIKSAGAVPTPSDSPLVVATLPGLSSVITGNATEGDYRSSGWAGEATKRIWMRRAKIAVEAMSVPTEDTNADDDQEELK